MESITIRISATDQGGYLYDIWKGDQIDMDTNEDSDDGGQCTTTMLNALGMASIQAAELIRQEVKECEACDGLGWLRSDNGDSRGLHTERCDECKKYPNDLEAQKVYSLSSECKNKDANGNACWNCDMGNTEEGDCGGEPVL